MEKRIAQETLEWIRSYRPHYLDNLSKGLLFDVGCGPADVLTNFICQYAHGRQNFKRIVGIDISHTMIDYAEKLYATDDFIMEFFRADIQNPQEMKRFKNKFDHVTSFCCLNWVQDQR